MNVSIWYKYKLNSFIWKRYFQILMMVIITMLISSYPYALFISGEYKIIRYRIKNLIVSSKIITKEEIVFHIQKHLVNT